ncbi:hypothetical protein G6F57_021105 [Rhizopus arrhizus]|nr:hypothetical protein G6F57_021105 [Rhizopus arrhizus]
MAPASTAMNSTAAVRRSRLEALRDLVMMEPSVGQQRAAGRAYIRRCAAGGALRGDRRFGRLGLGVLRRFGGGVSNILGRRIGTQEQQELLQQAIPQFGGGAQLVLRHAAGHDHVQLQHQEHALHRQAGEALFHVPASR